MVRWSSLYGVGRAEGASTARACGWTPRPAVFPEIGSSLHNSCSVGVIAEQIVGLARNLYRLRHARRAPAAIRGPVHPRSGGVPVLPVDYE